MPERPENLERLLISGEAAQWFLLLQDPELSLEERRDFVRWLKQSPAHVAEFLRVRRLHAHLRLADLPDEALEHADLGAAEELSTGPSRPGPRS